MPACLYRMSLQYCTGCGVIYATAETPHHGLLFAKQAPGAGEVQLHWQGHSGTIFSSKRSPDDLTHVFDAPHGTLVAPVVVAHVNDGKPRHKLLARDADDVVHMLSAVRRQRIPCKKATAIRNAKCNGVQSATVLEYASCSAVMSSTR